MASSDENELRPEVVAEIFPGERCVRIALRICCANPASGAGITVEGAARLRHGAKDWFLSPLKGGV
jgi:hypothetical protein